ncbi:MAG: single-stranded-DNA-specific exonuclease RecJ [Thermosynechococcaceae cyanobacterium MS004]|nr:single-stranded-DNA-specific exonuclease RecJ [Thermosynechococcaceae cyanobacterium MS004]
MPKRSAETDSTAAAPNLPLQRWQICPASKEAVQRIAEATGLLPILAQVLINRGIETPDAVQAFLAPESQVLPSPLEEFPDLAVSLELLEQAILDQEKILICGDYDADGMTSTALLLRSLRALGGQVEYAIPSRMTEGYGINQRMVEEFAAEGGRLVLTVDNGIAAQEPIAIARQLGLAVIVTDHHDLPPQLPPANAILNPKLLPKQSLYSGLAGVGVAYILAAALAQQMGQTQNLVAPLLELFTLGTIADLAPLVGVNRRWLQRGLKRLPHSQLTGVRALIEVSGSGTTAKQAFKPETIGFRLGPRINAVGRIGDPQTVIELLTTQDEAIAQARALECEQANQQRQQLCRDIEAEAIAFVESSSTLAPTEHRVLVLIQGGWHHGVIGIVASRLVERYGVPVFIGTFEDEAQTLIRGSVRSIPEFDVFEALQFCHDLLDKFGGHPAAGGFTLQAENLPALRLRLREFAHRHLQPAHLKPLVKIDAQADFSEINWELYSQMDRLQPCGMGNAEPTFWTPQVQVLEQRIVGQAHLKMTITQGHNRDRKESQKESPKEGPKEGQVFSAIAWRWAEYHPLPAQVDVAYRLRENTWNGETNLELEIVGVRPASPVSAAAPSIPSRISPPDPASALELDQVSVEPSKIVPNPQPEPMRSPLLPSTEPIIYCPPPPMRPDQPLTWHTIEYLDRLLPKLSGDVLLYGYQRPYVAAQDLDGTLTYDRPQGICQTLLLWTLPPSRTHLGWLLALAQPTTIYLRNRIPKLPDAATLRSQLSFQIIKNPEAKINLLDLGQKWWVAPSTMIAALREMDYPCDSFAPTDALEQELQRLERWYLCPAQRLAQIF